jgi:aconitate decarboxylase
VHVEIHFTDGTVERETCEAPRGSEKSFASEADITSKFGKLARNVMPDSQRDALAEAILGMEKLGSAQQLIKLLRVDANSRD